MGVTSRGQNLSIKYVADGNAKFLEIPHGADYVLVKNLTQWGASANPGVHVQAEYYPSLAAGEALTIQNDNSANSVELEKITSGGFTLLDPDNMPTFAAKSITSIDQSASAAFAVTGHGYVVGDLVRVYATTGMLQIASMLFSVKAVASANEFDVFLDSSGFAAAASGGSVQKIADKRFIPHYNYVTKISKASQAVVEMSINVVDAGYEAGQQLKMRIPSVFGMVEMDGKLGTIQSVDAANNTVTLDIDSSGFTTFAFPASGAVPFDFALAEPYGNVLAPNALLPGTQGLTRNRSKIQLELGTSIAGAASDVMEVILISGDRREVLS